MTYDPAHDDCTGHICYLGDDPRGCPRWLDNAQAAENHYDRDTDQ